MRVPTMDLRPQYERLRDEIRAAVDEVLESQHFILGPNVEAFENEICGHCDVAHAVGVSSGSDALLSWGSIVGETGYDIARGDLGNLRSSGGDFSAATTTEECLDNNRTTSSMRFSGTPAVGDGFWFLVRGQNCGGNGTYDTGAASQSGLRDTEIAGSGNDCS